MNNGFIIVATRTSYFYDRAIACANSILAFFPDARITLFTTNQLFDSIHENFFDRVVLDTPNEVRGKLWAMANTPYENTLYIDADCVVMHEDIEFVFDELGSNNMLWTRITADREYAYTNVGGSNRVFPGGEFKIHGGVCLYNSLAKKFMNDWYKLDKKIRDNLWWPDADLYPTRFKKWDQFSLWWLTEKEYDNYRYLRWDFFENDARWNYLNSYHKAKDHTNGTSTVILHHPWAGNK